MHVYVFNENKCPKHREIFPRETKQLSLNHKSCRFLPTPSFFERWHVATDPCPLNEI